MKANTITNTPEYLVMNVKGYLIVAHGAALDEPRLHFQPRYAPRLRFKYTNEETNSESTFTRLFKIPPLKNGISTHCALRAVQFPPV